MSVRTLSLTSHQVSRFRTDSDVLAEELAAEEFGFSHDADAADWYDASNDAGSKMEVKSCLSTVGQKQPRTGRFRLWEEQLQSLHAANASGTAWVAFVTYDMDNREVLLRRVTPATASQMVRDRGGWNKSGHSAWNRQHKLPWTEVM